MTREFFQGVSDKLAPIIAEFEAGLDPSHDLHGTATIALNAFKSAQEALQRAITAAEPAQEALQFNVLLDFTGSDGVAHKVGDVVSMTQAQADLLPAGTVQVQTAPVETSEAKEPEDE